MTADERIRRLVEALPSPMSAVTLTRADLEAFLDAPAQLGERDLTVDEVAAEMGRAPSTVRGWLAAGDLGGFKLNNRDWRVPRSALVAYRERQAGAPGADETAGAGADIGAWRKVRGLEGRRSA